MPPLPSTAGFVSAASQCMSQLPAAMVSMRGEGGGARRRRATPCARAADWHAQVFAAPSPGSPDHDGGGSAFDVVADRTFSMTVEPEDPRDEEMFSSPRLGVQLVSRVRTGSKARVAQAFQAARVYAAHESSWPRRCSLV